MSIKPSYEIRLLESADELFPTEKLTDEIWRGGAQDIVPTHMLTAFVHNGGLAIGAFENDKMIGFLFGFPGLYNTPKGLKTKHSSHQMGVHPAHRGKNIGFALKQAQWQMVRQQGLDLITWTYDPLLSRNAYLNIAQLGAICNTYKRDEYGEMVDGLNAGVASDRFQVDWWLNTPRVFQRLDVENRTLLGLENYQAAEAQMLYTPETNADLGLLRAPKHYSPPSAKLILLQIPNDFQKLRTVDLPLAKDWRFFTREVFEKLFNAGYIITDFIYDRSETTPRSFYVLTDGESTIG
ncbi:MAG: GNAT family N-acetyltransferase [Chloroflexi bacterium]|nr:GNAT family N-acetyltransferase [Chloroflexota bacterium]